MTVSKLLTDYSIALSKLEGGIDYGNEARAELTAIKMLEAVTTCATKHGHTTKFCDWLKHNGTLAKACKLNGIKDNADLRQLLLSDN